MKRFLTLKSWQLLLIINSPIILVALGFGDGIIILIVMYLFWLYLLGVQLHKIIYGNLIGIIKLNLSIIFSVLFLAGNAVLNYNRLAPFQFWRSMEGMDLVFAVIYCILSIFYIVSFFYILFFVSRRISVLKKTSQFEIFIQLIFFEIGLWFLQPKIKEILTQQGRGVPRMKSGIK